MTVDEETCIGCKSCMEACPYDVRRLIENEPEYYLELPIGDPAAKSHKGGTVEKCDFCAGRIDRGEKPACMELCPGRARYWGDLDDPESEVSQFLSGRNATVLLEGRGDESLGLLRVLASPPSPGLLGGRALFESKEEGSDMETLADALQARSCAYRLLAFFMALPTGTSR